MIPRILTSTRTFKSSLTYNVEKVIRGVATQVMCRNMPDDSLATIWATFRRLEQNEAVHARTRAFGFHMSLNPDITDTVSEQGICECVDELMEHIGYGKQPYVLFRHNDIDREHYHLVSMKVDSDGKSLWKTNDAKDVMAFLRSVEKKYGFKVGKMEELRDDVAAVLPLEKAPRRFNPAGADVRRQLVSIFNSALEWNFTSMAQFRSIMESMGVYVSEYNRKKGSGKVMVLRGLDEKGMKATRPYSMESNFGVLASEAYEQARERNEQSWQDREYSRMKVLSVCEFALDRSRSLAQFQQICAQAGVDVQLTRTLNQPAGDIPDGIVLRDVKAKTAFNSEELGRKYAASEFRKFINSGIWHVADEQEKHSLASARLLSRNDIQTLYYTIQMRRNSLAIEEEEYRGITRHR